MHAPRPLRPEPDETPALHDEALEQLRFIRDTMESSTAFTAVPGRGMVAMGALALLAAALASRQEAPQSWLAVWLGGAALASAVGLATMAAKARAAEASLLRGAGRRFALAFLPPVLAAGALTAALVRDGRFDLLPGAWMLLYGVGTLGGGAFSVGAVPVMGACFALAGLAALFEPAAWGDVAMALTFGGLHLAFGAVVWRRHGG